jgi:hypothetical protein
MRFYGFHNRITKSIGVGHGHGTDFAQQCCGDVPKACDGAIELGTNLILMDCSAVTGVLSGLEVTISVASVQSMLYRDLKDL